ncbi:PspC domain-containing protein [Streptomyces corynorhini]|uniref:PspC domain-containing protein n=1 Tax=Streptomyces corynorhini TaxID=2282652 RepID=A0A370B7F7_9ACTN|nr:PspC domain-containing protein [Streptomyces corynorhini]RDG37738.1 PspC domain-containing protein [Streptomyces corynorhini]
MTQPLPPPPPAPPSAPGSAPDSAAPSATPPPALSQLRRGRRQKVLAGVCGGLGKHYDIDPVVFRIVIGVLTVTAGVGLIFYGFAWLLIPLDGEEENEGRRLLSGRVDGASLIAVLLALIGCGLFLSMLGNEETLSFAGLLSIAMVGAAVWSQRRRAAPADGAPVDSSAAHAAAEAPPETMAPPSPGSPSWWRDPLIKDGRGVPGGFGLPGADYLWGPGGSGVRTQAQPWRWHGAARWHPPRPPRPRGPRGTAGLVFLFAVLAAGLGTGLTWESQPLGTSVQIGLAAALAVFGIGLAVGSFLGRTGLGTVMLVVLTAGLLTGASVIPKDISTQWSDQRWTAASADAVRPHYELSSGRGTLDLRRVRVPEGQSVSTSARVAAGQLRVVVPEGVTVRVNAKAEFGNVRFPGERPDEANVSRDQTRERTLSADRTPGKARPGTLRLDLEVGFGQVEVVRVAS